MGKLRAKWNTTLEIATRDAENEDRLKREHEREQKARVYEEIRTRRIFEHMWGSGQPSTPIDAHPVARTSGSSFTWKELEVRFREIQAKTTPRQNVQAVFIRTEWNSGSVDEVWIVSGNLALRKELEYLGSIAARKLGITPSDNPHEDWLDRIREWVQQTGLDKDRNYSWRSVGSVNENGMIGNTESISLENLAELSAKFCMNLIARDTPESTASQSPAHSEIADRKSRSNRPIRKLLKTKQQLHRTAVIFGAIQLGLKGHRYCSELDARRLRPPEKWREEGCPETYVLSYRIPRWRKRVQDEKCRHRELYEKTPSQEREAIIQGKSGTRRTRH